MSAFALQASPEALASYVASFTIAGAVVDTTTTAAFTDTASNVVTPNGVARAIRIGTTGGGNLKVTYASGVVDVIAKLVAGQVVTGKFAKVFGTGSDVQDITIFW